MAEFSWFGKRNKPGPKADKKQAAEQKEVIQAEESLDEMVAALKERGMGDMQVAAHVLGEGYTVKQAAAAAGVDERTIYRWKHDPDFMQMVDTVTLTTGIANKAERVREAKRIVREVKVWRQQHGKPVSEKDILDWLKYIRDEQEGMRLFSDDQLEQIANAIVFAGSGGADDATGGPGTVDADGGSEAVAA